MKATLLNHLEHYTRTTTGNVSFCCWCYYCCCLDSIIYNSSSKKFFRFIYRLDRVEVIASTYLYCVFSKRFLLCISCLCPHSWLQRLIFFLQTVTNQSMPLFILIIWVFFSALSFVRETDACPTLPSNIGLSVSSFTSSSCTGTTTRHKFMLDGACTAFTIDNGTIIFIQSSCSLSGTYDVYKDSNCSTLQLSYICPTSCQPISSSFLNGACVATK